MMSEIPGTGERRHSPRHAIELAADLVLEDGTILPVSIRSISGSGMQILCDSWVTNEIEPRGIQVHSVSHIKLKLVTELPGLHGRHKLYVRCKIMSAQRMSQEEYTLNLAYMDFENGTESALDDFLDRYQQKKTIVKAAIAV
ncbi:MAG TPA: hypothetical protein ENJ64_01375 [Thiotrichales bacterium]|nr:hypothetical protein [Thiotrichales bacterium]